MDVKVVSEGFAKKLFVCINDTRHKGDGSYSVKVIEVSDTKEFKEFMELGFTDDKLRSIDIMDVGDVNEFNLGVLLVRVA